MYREELREMTQRAESLMDQLRKSKKSGKEMQAAHKSAREEFLTARLELQECQAQLRRQVFVPSQSSEPFAEVREARGSEKEADSTTLTDTTKDTGEDTFSLGRSFPVVEHWRGQARVGQCFSTLRKLHSELSKELQSRPTGQAAEDVISKILQQMDKALLDGPSPAGSEGGRAAPLSLRLPSSPEAERPIPEDLKDFKLSSASESVVPSVKFLDVIVGHLWNSCIASSTLPMCSLVAFVFFATVSAQLVAFEKDILRNVLVELGVPTLLAADILTYETESCYWRPGCCMLL
eukprot:symbB.v1.2.006234.t2/scaffold340.1/size245066/20